MRSLFLTVLILNLITSFSSAQELDAGVGINHINFIGNSDNGHDSAAGSGTGYEFQIGLDSIKTEVLTFRLELGLRHENSSVVASSGGQGGGSNYQSDFNKTVLFGTIYPINLRFAKHFQFSLGVQGNLLLRNAYVSSGSGYVMSGFSSSFEESGVGKERHKRVFLGLKVRQAFRIPLNEKFKLIGAISYVKNSKNEASLGSRLYSRNIGFNLGLSWMLNN